MKRTIAEEIIKEAALMFGCINRLSVITMEIEDEAKRIKTRRAIARIISELDDGLVRSVTEQFPELDCFERPPP